MPADSPLVTLTVWKDAKADPPRIDHDRLLVTDLGMGRYVQPDLYDDRGKWWTDTTVRMDPQPSVWCDPQPPGDDALTVEDLHLLANAAQYLVETVPSDEREGPATIWHAAARLRRALEQIGTP